MAYQQDPFLLEVIKMFPDLCVAEAKSGLALRYFPEEIGSGERASLEDAEELAGTMISTTYENPGKMVDTLLNPLSYLNPWKKGGILNQLVNSAFDWEDVAGYWSKNFVHGPLFATQAYGGIMRQGALLDKKQEPEVVDENGIKRFTKYGIHEDELKDLTGQTIHVYLPVTFDRDQALADLRDQGLRVSSRNEGLQFDPLESAKDETGKAERFEMAHDFHGVALREQVAQAGIRYQDISDRLAQSQAVLENHEDLLARNDSAYNAAAHHLASQEVRNIEQLQNDILVEVQSRNNQLTQYLDGSDKFNDEYALFSGDLVERGVESARQNFQKEHKTFLEWDRSKTGYKEKDSEVIDASSGQRFKDLMEKAADEAAKKQIEDKTKIFYDRNGYITITPYFDASSDANDAFNGLAGTEREQSILRESFYKRNLDAGEYGATAHEADSLTVEQVRCYQAAYRQKQKQVQDDLEQAQQQAMEWGWRRTQVSMEVARKNREAAEADLADLLSRKPKSPQAGVVIAGARQAVAFTRQKEQDAQAMLDQERISFQDFWQKRGQPAVDWGNFEEIAVASKHGTYQREQLLGQQLAAEQAAAVKAQATIDRLDSHQLSAQDLADIQAKADELNRKFRQYREDELKASLATSWQGYFDKAGVREDREKQSLSLQYDTMRGAAFYGALNHSKQDFIGIQKELLAVGLGFESLAHAQMRHGELTSLIAAKQTAYRAALGTLAAQDVGLESSRQKSKDLIYEKNVAQCRLHLLERKDLLVQQRGLSAKAQAGDPRAKASLALVEQRLLNVEQTLGATSVQVKSSAAADLHAYDIAKAQAELVRVSRDIAALGTSVADAERVLSGFKAIPAGAEAKKLEEELIKLRNDDARALEALVASGIITKADAIRFGSLDAKTLNWLHKLSDQELLNLNFSPGFLDFLKAQDPNRRDSIQNLLTDAKGRLNQDLNDPNLTADAKWLSANNHTKRILDVKYYTRDILQKLDVFIESGDLVGTVKAFAKEYFKMRVRALKFTYDQKTPKFVKSILKLTLSNKDFADMEGDGRFSLQTLVTSRTRQLRAYLTTKVFSTRWVVGLASGTKMVGSHWEQDLARKLLAKGGWASKLVAKGELRFVNLQDYLKFWGELGGRIQKKIFGTVSNKLLKNVNVQAIRAAFNQAVEKVWKKVMVETAKKLGQKAATWLAAQAARWGIEAATGVGAPAALVDMAVTVAWEAVTYFAKKTVSFAKTFFLEGEVKGPLGVLVGAGCGCFTLPLVGVLILAAVAGSALKDYSGFSSGSSVDFRSGGGTGGALCVFSNVQPCSVDCGIQELEWPVPSSRTITACVGCYSPFGTWEPHGGTDIGGSTGDSVVAAAGGSFGYCVDYLIPNCTGNTYFGSYIPDFGNYVVITGSDGVVYIYGHLSSVETSLFGSSVASGKKVGLMGSTGKSTGPHLHFEVRKNNTYVNPCGSSPGGFDCGGACDT